MTCGFAGCGRAVRTMGLCNGHYLQSWRGQELKPLRTVVYGTVAERMAAHTNRYGECWTWTGAQDGDGYGRVGVDGKVEQAHRVAYELAHGAIPAGVEIDHRCHTHSCVRPAHLQLATSAKNKENRAGASSNSKSGIRGVFWRPDRGKYVARVQQGGVTHHVGMFDDIAAAEAAVIARRNELFTNNLVDRGIAA